MTVRWRWRLINLVKHIKVLVSLAYLPGRIDLETGAFADTPLLRRWKKKWVVSSPMDTTAPRLTACCWQNASGCWTAA